MRPEVKKYLFDIHKACELIGQFAGAKSAEQYRNDPLLKSAVERQFQVIGEALQQLLRRFPEVAQQISDHRSIINFRNILVHGYDRIEDDVVWGVIHTKLPILSDEVERLLETK